MEEYAWIFSTISLLTPNSCERSIQLLVEVCRFLASSLYQTDDQFRKKSVRQAFPQALTSFFALFSSSKMLYLVNKQELLDHHTHRSTRHTAQLSSLFRSGFQRFIIHCHNLVMNPSPGKLSISICNGSFIYSFPLLHFQH